MLFRSCLAWDSAYPQQPLWGKRWGARDRGYPVAGMGCGQGRICSGFVIGMPMWLATEWVLQPLRPPMWFVVAVLPLKYTGFFVGLDAIGIVVMHALLEQEIRSRHDRFLLFASGRFLFPLPTSE